VSSSCELSLGSLDRIEAVLKLLGMVNAEVDFADHPKVITWPDDELYDHRLCNRRELSTS
jgi:hypothetical protein